MERRDLIKKAGWVTLGLMGTGWLSGMKRLPGYNLRFEHRKRIPMGIQQAIDPTIIDAWAEFHFGDTELAAEKFQTILDETKLISPEYYFLGSKMGVMFPGFLYRFIDYKNPTLSEFAKGIASFPFGQERDLKLAKGLFLNSVFCAAKLTRQDCEDIQIPDFTWSEGMPPAVFSFLDGGERSLLIENGFHLAGIYPHLAMREKEIVLTKLAKKFGELRKGAGFYQSFDVRASYTNLVTANWSSYLLVRTMQMLDPKSQEAVLIQKLLEEPIRKFIGYKVRNTRRLFELPWDLKRSR